MKRKESEIWMDEPEAVEETRKATPAPKRRKDTDLSEPSVRKSRRQIRKEEEEEAAAHAPWDDDAQGEPLRADADNPQEVEETLKPRTNTLASVLSGNILSKSEVRRAYPYMIFVACLMFLYIANVFRTQYIYRQHATLTEQVKELRAKSMTIASERMRATQQSNIMIELERRGIPLKESLTPNKVIPNPVSHGEKKNDR